VLGRAIVGPKPFWAKCGISLVLDGNSVGTGI
jgi:hypothetical protein